MKMIFSKNIRNTQYKPMDNTYNIQPMIGTRTRKYDMVSVANSGTKCTFCNR
jgi:hypothetical protein